MSDEVTLRVNHIIPGYTADKDRLIARIPVRIMKRLGVEPGDFVEITGRKTIYVEVWPVDPLDEDKDIVVMNEMIWRNAGVEVGDTVKVRKVSLRPAQRVILASPEPAKVDTEYLKKQVLLGKPVTRGQIFKMYIYYESKTYVHKELIEFAVVQVQPEPAAYVSVDTEVLLRGESAKEPARE